MEIVKKKLALECVARMHRDLVAVKDTVADDEFQHALFRLGELVMWIIDGATQIDHIVIQEDYENDYEDMVGSTVELTAYTGKRTYTYSVWWA